MRKILIFLMALAMLCVCTAVYAEQTAAVTLDVSQAYQAGDAFVEQFGVPAPEGQEKLPVILLRHKKHMKMQIRTLPETVKSAKITAYSEDSKIVSVIGTTLTGEKTGQTVVHLIREKEPAAEQLVRVIVFQPVRKITIKAPVKHVEPGMTISLSAKVVPEKANVQTVTWLSSDESIATVDANGTVTGVKRGAVRITALADDGSGIRDSVRIQVTRPMGVGDLIEDEPDPMPENDAGMKYTARLSEFDPTDNTVLVDITERIMIPREIAESLKVGSTIQIGTDKVTVDTLHMEKDTICINDVYYLDATEGSEMAVSDMSMPLYEVAESWTMEIPDTLVFVDGINAENGQPLDKPVEHTAAELKAMLQQIDGVDFSTDNVYVMFNEEGDLIRVERFYTPYQ